MKATELMQIRALAADYDRTLTTPDLELEERTVAALRRAREGGLKVIVISGRPLSFLREKLDGAVDAYVAENGCFVALPDTHEAVPTFDAAFEDRHVLKDAGIDVEWWDAMGSCHVDDYERVKAELEGHAVDLIPNRESLMILPRGVNKAVGLDAAAKYVGVDLREVAAAGDGENDVDMLRVAGLGVAVANAVPDLKAHADHVTGEPGGRGVVRWLQDWARAQGGVLKTIEP